MMTFDEQMAAATNASRVAEEKRALEVHTRVRHQTRAHFGDSRRQRELNVHRMVRDAGQKVIAERKNSATMCVQKMWRGYKGRERSRCIRHYKSLHAQWQAWADRYDERLAAKLIQKRWRGYMRRIDARDVGRFEWLLS